MTRHQPNFRLLVTALTLASIALAAPCARAQNFGLFASAFLDSTRAPSARITVEVPFRTLVFLKKEGYYDARFESYLSIRRTDIERARPTTYVLNGFATVKTYDETKQRDQKARVWREIKLAPGEYEIDAILRIRETIIAVSRSVTLRVPDFLASGMGFGTPQVLSIPPNYTTNFARWSEVKDRLAGADAPENAAIVGLERQPGVRFAIYFDSEVRVPSPCDIYYEVTDGSGRQVLYGKRRVELRGDDDEFVIAFNVDEWAPGVYRVNLRAQMDSPARDATASVDVRVDVTRAMLGANFDDTIEILSLIASGDDLKELRAAPEAGRAAAWAKFWSARDPDPSTPENEALAQYLERVQYVVKEFSQFGAGWKSDRGRVYIRYGAPEQIDTAMDQRAQGEYEIWRYYSLNRTFVFYDMFGVGDFKLVEGEL